MFFKFYFNLFLLSFILPLNAVDIELTVLVGASQLECFHQNLEAGKILEIEYEVLAGGDFDINFWLYSPTMGILKKEFNKRDGHETLKLEESGEYKFCLDNIVSRFHQKQVYFSLRYISQRGITAGGEYEEPWMETMDKDELGDLQSKVSDIKDTLIASLNR